MEGGPEGYKQLAERCMELASECSAPSVADALRALALDYLRLAARAAGATVVVPPSMAERQNTDALAVLAVIRDEAKATGKCELPVARIAERANIGRARARAAIRLAETLGAITIEETPSRKRVFVYRCVS
jgi:hypothetical protein